jgi:predicted Zn finger-like uncharacterized protein
MIIQCESCASKFFLSDSSLPSRPMRVSCPKCRAVFRLVPRREKVFASPRDAVVGSAAASARPAPDMPALSSEGARREKGPARRGPEERARRLARVLVSDILCYNRDKRDQALLEGNLMAALGDEIKKSWELYKQKVGPELAGSTNYFKEALNEILADGQSLF